MSQVRVLDKISEPTRFELATTSVVTVKLIERVTNQTRERGNGSGAIANGIRTAAAATVKRRNRAKAKRARNGAAEAERVAQDRLRLQEEEVSQATPEERELGFGMMRLAMGSRL